MEEAKLSYYQRNREKLLAKSRESYRLKTSTPENREKYLNYFRQYYRQNTKPKLAKKNEPEPKATEVKEPIKVITWNDCDIVVRFD